MKWFSILKRKLINLGIIYKGIQAEGENYILYLYYNQFNVYAGKSVSFLRVLISQQIRVVFIKVAVLHVVYK